MILLIWLGSDSGIVMADNEAAGSSGASGYSLDIANRTLVKTIGQEIAAPQAVKFVKIEVAEVFNPQKIPLSFSIHYQPARGKKNLLGTFSLFPPDNPGTFLIATGGRLRSGGLVIVSLVPLEPVDERAEIRVKLKRITFIED